MPAILALGDLGTVAAAAFATLLAVAAYLLLRALAYAIGSVGIGPFSFNLGRVVAGALNGVADWIVNQTAAMWGDVGVLFHATAYIFSQIFGDVADAIGHVSDQVVHLFTVEIPGAISQAERTAAADVRRVVGGVTGDITRARLDLGRALDSVARAEYVRIAREASTVEHDLAAAVSHGVDHAEHFATVQVHRLADTVAHDLAATEKTLKGDIADVKSTLGKQLAALAGVVASDYTAARQYAQSQAAAALSTATSLVNQARTEAENVAAADANRVQQLLQAAIDTTNSTVSALTSTVSTDFTAAEQQAHAEVAQAVQTVTGQLQSTADSLQAAINAGTAAAAAGVAGALDQAQTDATQALGAATGTINDVLDGIAQDVAQGVGAYHGDLAATAGLVAGAITAAVAGVTSRVAKLEKCSVGVCSDSPNNFGNLLKDALGLASLAGVGVFLKQAIDNPAQADQDIAGTVATAYGGAQSGLDLLLSL